MGLSLENLCVSYADHQVIRDVSLELKPGEIMGLIGPNGSGKSTLMKAVLGLLPSSGTISYGGVELSRLSHKQRALQVSYMAQERDVAWDLTVERVLALGLEAIGHTAKTQAHKEQLERTLEELQLLELRDTSILKISGGERARVLLGRALLQDTPMILADEPTAGLDPEHQLELLQIFLKLREQERSLLVSLHDWTYAARLCSTIALLDQGRLVALGTPQEVLVPEQIRQTYRVDVHVAQLPGGPVITPTHLSR